VIASVLWAALSPPAFGPVPSPPRVPWSIPRRASQRRRPVMTTGSSRCAVRLIDNEKDREADRIKALIARASAYDRKT